MTRKVGYIKCQLNSTNSSTGITEAQFCWELGENTSRDSDTKRDAAPAHKSPGTLVNVFDTAFLTSSQTLSPGVGSWFGVKNIAGRT